MIHITAYRPSNGNIPETWTQVDIRVNNHSELEQKRQYWRDFHKVPEVDIMFTDTIITDLGTAKTIGELKRRIERYADDVPFGFRNQEPQNLYEIRHKDETFICFQLKK